MARRGRFAVTRSLGMAVVRGMPAVLRLLLIVGTAAMIWVGGAIIVHGFHELGWHLPYETIHTVALAAAHAVPQAEGAVEWAVTAALDGLVGLLLGAILLPVVKYALAPLAGLFARKA
jgi:predicted DNA repair protein MutK